jgi:hypothetical protein
LGLRAVAGAGFLDLGGARLLDFDRTRSLAEP